MPAILFADESDESRSLPLNAQRLVNFFTEKQRPGAKSQTPLFGVPGLSAFANTSVVTGAIAGLGSITGGSGYGGGVYSNVPLTGGSGSGAVATVTISGGAVTAVAITVAGVNYVVNDVLSASNAYLGGVGSGFSVPVATLSNRGIAAAGVLNPGGYTPASINNSYFNIPLTGGSGSGATVNVHIQRESPGLGFAAVTSFQIVNPGINYQVGDALVAEGFVPPGVTVLSNFTIQVTTLTGGGIASLGSITGGSGYDGTMSYHANVPLTGGHGSGALGNITIASGAVSDVAISAPGIDYEVSDVLSAVLGGQIETFGSIVPGSGYVDATYTAVPLTGGAGTGAQGTITVSGGVVTDVVITVGGFGYQMGDVLSATTASLGGAGSGFSVPVTSVSGGSGFSVPVSVVNTAGPIRGSWVRQDIPYVVAGNSLYQLGSSIGGTYSGVPLTGGNGSGATADITIAGGVVTAVALDTAGINYQVGDVLSAPLGGGTGFSISVATITTPGGIATLGPIAGGSNYVIGSSTLVGSNIGGTDLVSMSDNGFQLCIVSGEAGLGWILDTNPQSATFGFQQITDPAFYPANTVSFFDGYFIFDRIGTNEFFLSNLYDGTTYNALDFASAESQPDFVTGTIQNLQLLFVICQEHLELWYDAGAFPFPFARYTGAGISYGCISPKTIIRQDGAIFFLGTDKVFYRLQSTVPIRTSTHSAEHIIAQDGDITKAYCFTFTLEGHKMIGLTLPVSKRTLMFDISTGRWHDRESWDQNNASLGIWRATTAFRAFNETYIGDAFNGNVNLLDWTVYTELGNTIRGLAYSIPYHQDRKRLFMSRFELDIQAGVGTPSGVGSDPQIQLGWSVDGAQTFQPLQFWRSMGKIGQYLQRLRWLRMGNARQFVFVISCTDPVPRVIIAAHADFSVGM